MRNLSGRLSAIQVVVHACSCVAFLLDVIVDVAAAYREISLSDHTDQGIVAGVVVFGDHLTKQGLYVGSQGDSFFPEAGVGSFHDKQLDDAGRVHAGVVDGE